MNNIAINNTIQSFTASRKTISAKTDGSDFGIALQGAFSYSEVRGVNAIASNALEMLDDELEDMYIVSNAHKLQLAMGQWGIVSYNEYDKAFDNKREKFLELCQEGNCIQVRIDPGKFNEFVEELQTGLANGDSLRDVLQNHFDSYGDVTHLNHGEFFTIDPDTGMVEIAHTQTRNIYGSAADSNMDILTSLAIADDLATVMRYTYFKEETDDPVKVQALITGICERSNGYNTERFNPLWDTAVEHPREWYVMMQEKLGYDDEPRNDMVDSLLELLDRHFKAEQKREAENDDFGSSSLTVAAMAAKIAMSKTKETELSENAI